MQIRTTQRTTDTRGDTQNAVNQMWILGFFLNRKDQDFTEHIRSSNNELLTSWACPEFVQHTLLSHPFVPEVPRFQCDTPALAGCSPCSVPVPYHLRFM